MGYFRMEHRVSQPGEDIQLIAAQVDSRRQKTPNETNRQHNDTTEQKRPTPKSQTRQKRQARTRQRVPTEWTWKTFTKLRRT